jgi:hypothetical protein
LQGYEIIGYFQALSRHVAFLRLQERMSRDQWDDAGIGFFGRIDWRPIVTPPDSLRPSVVSKACKCYRRGSKLDADSHCGRARLRRSRHAKD